MREWFAKQYDDIKGHFKWALLVVFWALGAEAVKTLLRLIPHIPEWTVWAVLFLLSAVAFVWIAKSQKRSGQGGLVSQAKGAISLVTSTATFDAQKYFRLAYHSPLTEDAEANIRKAAVDNQPNDREGFYARFIGVGLIVYIYDMIWFSIYRSQLLALLELNRKNGLLPLAELRTYYDQAATSHPTNYVHYTFDQWLSYMKSQSLFIVHPSNMVEITLRGKDFLKYLLHYGREPDQLKL